MTGIVFIRVKAGYEKEVMEQIISLDEVSKAYRVFGDYDLIVITRDVSLERLKKVVEKIRSIDNVLSTSTLVVITKKTKK